MGAPDAFVDGKQRCIDVGCVNGVFVNNVAMGVYGAVVQSPEYRAHKVRTVVAMLPDLLGPAAERFDLRFAAQGGRTFDRAALVLVSDNPYVIDPRAGKGTRGDIDGGVLGVIAVTGPPPRGKAEWTAVTFLVDSAAPIRWGSTARASSWTRRSGLSRGRRRSWSGFRLAEPFDRRAAPSRSAEGRGSHRHRGRSPLIVLVEGRGIIL